MQLSIGLSFWVHKVDSGSHNPPGSGSVRKVWENPGRDAKNPEETEPHSGYQHPQVEGPGTEVSLSLEAPQESDTVPVGRGLGRYPVPQLLGVVGLAPTLGRTEVARGPSTGPVVVGVTVVVVVVDEVPLVGRIPLLCLSRGIHTDDGLPTSL